ncbi:hypothetical protein BJ170DRAFT_727318 [Xylariales sp. AK1849]|nr:hypothetical protein BJ170DRAFT_727318 [Xylariales sp. AK1849]
MIILSAKLHRANWAEQLSNTEAQHSLKRGRPDEVHLDQIQAATNELLVRKKVASIATETCDLIMIEHLTDLKGELWAHHVGIVACIHAFTYDRARDVILFVKPDPKKAHSDVFFERRVSAYLQTIMLARKANKYVIPETLSVAAHELFKASNEARDARRFPSITNLLQALGKDSCVEFLPTDLVMLVLHQCGYRDRLKITLDTLTRTRQWIEARRLVRGLRDLPHAVGDRESPSILSNVIPDYMRWVSWQPNDERITLWGAGISEHHRQQLERFLALEGPDVSRQGRRTSCHSPEAVNMLGFTVEVAQSELLGQLLDLLDGAVRIGSGAIDLFISLYAEHHSFDRRSLARIIEQLRTVFEMNCDVTGKNSVANRLLRLRHVLATSNVDDQSFTLKDRMEAFVSTLPFFADSPRMQSTFGVGMDLGPRAAKSLSDVQKQFRNSLLDNRATVQDGLKIATFARVLLEAHWLWDKWTLEYVVLLRQIPTELEIKFMIRAFQKAEDDSKQRHMDDLAARLAFSPRKGQVTGVPPPASVPEDPVWYNKLDIDRDTLRRQVFLPSKKVNISLATSCLKQSLKESDTFVRELIEIIRRISDQVVVNLAAFLGPRAASHRGVHESWKALLMHMMRQLPAGLLDRCGAQLPRDTFKSWIKDLRRLYHDHFLGPAGGLGMNDEKIQQWMVRTRGLGRSTSASTTTTNSTNASGETYASASS